MTSNKTRKIINVITIIGTVLVCVFFYFALKAEIFTSEEKMKMFLEQAGVFAPVIFVLIQIVQVVIPLIPGGRYLLCCWFCFWHICCFSAQAKV